MKPKVSIIMPIYKVEAYIRKSLTCLVNQTLKDIEIICIDDLGGVYYYYLQRANSITKKVSLFSCLSALLSILKQCVLVFNLPLEKDGYNRYIKSKINTFFTRYEQMENRYKGTDYSFYQDLCTSFIKSTPYFDDFIVEQKKYIRC